MHNDFFCVHDHIQYRYELVRSVKYENMAVTDALNMFGLQSRASYYLFSRQMRKQGFMGLFDLRTIGKKVKNVNSQITETISYDDSFNSSQRPGVSIWEGKVLPVRNAFFGLSEPNCELFVQIVRALVEGNGVRGISRIFDVDKNTVLEYLKKAAFQCRLVTDYYLRNMLVEELQLDEMWGFVYKKEKNQTEDEYESALIGDQWCWIAIDARTKVIVQYEIGKRTYRLADDLIKNFKHRTNGTPPALIMSDEYKGYKVALLKNYGVTVNHKKMLPKEMDYAVVKKTRKKGRVVDIDVRIVFGEKKRIEMKLQDSPVSNNVNVAFVERSNLSRRQFNRRLARKTLGFSKKLENHLWHFEIETAFYNFVRPHSGLKKKTPMMAAGKTDHVWKTEELLAFSGQ